MKAYEINSIKIGDKVTVSAAADAFEYTVNCVNPARFTLEISEGPEYRRQFVDISQVVRHIKRA